MGLCASREAVAEQAAGGAAAGGGGRAYLASGSADPPAAVSSSFSQQRTTPRISIPSLHSKFLFSISCYGGTAFAAASHPNGLLTGGDDGRAHWIDWTNGQRVATLAGHTRSIHCTAFVDAQTPLWCLGSRDKTISLWSAVLPSSSDSDSPPTLDKPLRSLTGHTLNVSCLSTYSSGGGGGGTSAISVTLVSGSRDYSVRWWDVETGACKTRTEIEQNVITGVKCFDEYCVLQCGEDLTLRVWDVRTRKVAQEYKDGPSFSLSCDVSPSRTTFLTTHNGFEGNGCDVKLWDRRQQGAPLYVWPGDVTGQTAHSETVYMGRFVSDSTLVTCSKDTTVRVWQTTPNQSEQSWSLCGGAHVLHMPGDLTPVCVQPLSRGGARDAQGDAHSFRVAMGSTGGALSVFEYDGASADPWRLLLSSV